MGRLLIQIDARLLWQILVEAKPESLQALDRLLAVLGGAAGTLPVQAHMVESDWDWLQQRIRSHYEFDLAEEILLQLDRISFCRPDPGDFLYAVLRAAGELPAPASEVTQSLHLSLPEFLTLYESICQLEATYRHVVRLDERSPDPASWLNGEFLVRLPQLSRLFAPPVRLTPGLTDRLPRSTQDQALLLGVALLLVLLPHLVKQEWLLSPVQAETPDSPDLANLIQAAATWLNQTTQHLSPESPIAATQPSPQSSPDSIEVKPLQPLSQTILQAVQTVARSGLHPIATAVEEGMNPADPGANPSVDPSVDHLAPLIPSDQGDPALRPPDRTDADPLPAATPAHNPADLPVESPDLLPSPKRSPNPSDDMPEPPLDPSPTAPTRPARRDRPFHRTKDRPAIADNLPPADPADRPAGHFMLPEPPVVIADTGLADLDGGAPTDQLIGQLIGQSSWQLGQSVDAPLDDLIAGGLERTAIGNGSVLPEVTPADSGFDRSLLGKLESGKLELGKLAAVKLDAAISLETAGPEVNPAEVSQMIALTVVSAGFSADFSAVFGADRAASQMMVSPPLIS